MQNWVKNMLGPKISRLKEIIRWNDAEMRKNGGKENVTDQLTKPVLKQDFQKFLKVIDDNIIAKTLIPMTSQVNQIREVKPEVESR